MGWAGDSLSIAFQNSELGDQAVLLAPRTFVIDEEPTDEQWALLARAVTTAVFGR